MAKTNKVNVWEVLRANMHEPVSVDSENIKAMFNFGGTFE